MTLPIDVEAVRRAAVVNEPFPHLMVPGFVRPEAIDAIERDFPAVAHAGSFPLPTLNYGPRFQDFMDAIRGPEFTEAVADKFGIDLSRRPTMVTVRGQSSARDGQIHTDSVTKLVTVLIYMNGKWESPKGRLRLLRSATDLNDVVAEVPPDEGTLVVFRNQPNAWHGFEAFEGPRKVIQLNWVTNGRVVWWEQTRHKISAFFKGKHQAPARM
ncbi:MAG: 2OG-Fe(II) oxygenase [Alphaproteobacteria bacterium]|nr:2OG-Fe(II) oxygenase [Alphaproteobacteria bacterium]